MCACDVESLKFRLKFRMLNEAQAAYNVFFEAFFTMSFSFSSRYKVFLHCLLGHLFIVTLQEVPIEVCTVKSFFSNCVPPKTPSRSVDDRSTDAHPNL